MKQIISLGVGQAGIQLADSCWELFSVQHSINPNGSSNIIPNQPSFYDYFREIKAGSYEPHSIFMDLQPTVIDQIKLGRQRELYSHQNLISGKEDASSNFSRGKYGIGMKLIDICLDSIRKQVEKCEEFQGFLIYHSLGGGTGSGFGSLLLERLSSEYNKKTKVGLNINPSGRLSTSCVQPYNATISAHYLLEHQDASIIFDNTAMYNICQRNLDIQVPTYDSINKLAAHVVSSLTICSTFNNHYLNSNLSQFQTSLVPFPRLHLMLTSYSPIVRSQKVYFQKLSPKQITRTVFDQANVMSGCDPRLGKYMACCLHYRGNFIPRDVGVAVSDIKKRKSIQFVDWCSTGLKVGINYSPFKVVSNDSIAKVERSCCMISNNTAISSVIQRNNRKFDLMYAKRAFVHWYTGQGMEGGELIQARQDLAALERDYQQVSQDTEINES